MAQVQRRARVRRRLETKARALRGELPRAQTRVARRPEVLAQRLEQAVLGLAQARQMIKALEQAEALPERELVPLQVQLRNLPGTPIIGAPRGLATMQRKRRSPSGAPI